MGLLQKLEKGWAAILFSLVILLIFYNAYPNSWKFIVSILLAYLVADVAKFLMIRGGKCIKQFPFLGTTQTQHDGHSYLIFLVYIILGTILGAYIGDYVAKNFIENMVGWMNILIPNGIIVLLVYLDFWITFKER